MLASIQQNLTYFFLRVQPIVKTRAAELFALCLLFLLSHFMRFEHFPNTLVWTGDVARDFHVGYLIKYHDTNTQFGHYNSGIDYYYPPYYYYFMAFLNSVTNGDAISMYAILLTLQSFLPIVFYFAAKPVTNKKIALIFSILIAISPYFIWVSHFPLTAHMSLLPFIISIILFFNALYRKNSYFLVFSALTLSITASIFYGAMIFFPFFALILLINGKYQDLTYHQILKNILLFFCASIFFYFLVFFPIINKESIQTLLIPKNEFSEVSDKNHINKINENFSYTLNILSHTNINFPVIHYATVLALIYLLIKKDFDAHILSTVTLFLFLLHVILVPEYKFIHYYTLLIPILLLFYTFISYKLHQHNSFAAVLYILLIFYAAPYLPTIYQITNYFHFKSVHSQIAALSDNKVIAYNSECQYNQFPGWESQSFWFFSENKSDYLLSKLDNQIMPPTNSYVYVCETLNESNITNNSTLKNEYINNESNIYKKINVDGIDYYVSIAK